MKRGNYNEIVLSSLTDQTRKTVKNLVQAAAQGDHVDEHGNWSFGAEFDRKGRGSSLNWDLYGVGRDKHSGRVLAVVQVRQYVKQHKNWFPQIRKSYFLLGRNEDHTVFAHAVSAGTVHSAIRREVNVVQAVQKWIFGAQYEEVVRQGDIALVPLKKRPQGEYIGTEMVIQDSHKLFAEEIVEGANLYALNPFLTHLPGTHPEVDGDGYGWFKVVVGNRADFYEFAAPTID